MYLLTLVVTLALVSVQAATGLKYLNLLVKARTQTLQLSWENLKINGTITVRNGPKTAASDVLFVYTITANTGLFDTGVFYNYSQFRNIFTKNTSCYGYYAYYQPPSDFASSIYSCIRAYPTWMQDMKASIGNMMFREIVLPGTHDSAAYKANFNLAKDDTSVNKYVFTQDEDIRGQLMGGIRYLDIRPAYYPNSAIKFWVNHGPVQVQPLEQVLRDVYNFVLETNEIVIIGFHEFPTGFSSDDTHRLLIQFVNQTIGDQLVTNSSTWGTKLNQIWDQPRRIILEYAQTGIDVQYGPLVWSAVDGRWANTDNVATLQSYLYAKHAEGPTNTNPISDMVQLTPTTFGVIFNQYGGLRKMADDTNPLASGWYRHDLLPTSNIINLDFFRGTSIVEDAIAANENRTPIWS